MREVRAADFFLQLPDELEIQRQALLRREARRHQRGEGRAFVVRSAASQVAVALALEHERLVLPLRLVGGLHVHVVVDGHCRVVGVDGEVAKNHRIARRFDELGRRPARPQYLRRPFCPALNIVGVRWVHAHRWNLHQVAQPGLEFLAHGGNGAVQVSIELRVRGHAKSPLQGCVFRARTAVARRAATIARAFGVAL